MGGGVIFLLKKNIVNIPMVNFDSLPLFFTCMTPTFLRWFLERVAVMLESPIETMASCGSFVVVTLKRRHMAAIVLSGTCGS